MGISNTQYRDIMFQYDQTRMNNQRILDKRYETLFAEIPELEQIQHDIMDLSLTQARKELFQTEPDQRAKLNTAQNAKHCCPAKRHCCYITAIRKIICKAFIPVRTAKTPAIRTTNLVTALKTLRLRLFMKVQILWTF